MRHLFLAPLLRWLGRLSHPKLFLVIGCLFLISVVVPDPIPLVDELLLGLGTVLLARRKQPDTDAARAPIEGQARRQR